MDEETPEYEVYSFERPEETVNHNTIALRAAALEDARMFVLPICEVYPLEAYRITTGPTLPLTTPPNSTMTAAEQAIGLIITIADWLLEAQ